jgi:hypothetical protein
MVSSIQSEPLTLQFPAVLRGKEERRDQERQD